VKHQPQEKPQLQTTEIKIIKSKIVNPCSEIKTDRITGI
jgi:hypothetical protein